MGFNPATMGLISAGIGFGNQLFQPEPGAQQMSQPGDQNKQAGQQAVAQQLQQTVQPPQPQQQGFGLGTTSGQLPPEIMQLLMATIGGVK